MSKTLVSIKAAQLEARRHKEILKVSLLTTLLGAAISVGKTRRNAESTEEEVLSIIKKFEKGVLETISILERGGGSPTKVVELKEELAILRGFLPAKLEDAEVLKAIGEVLLSEKLPYAKPSLRVVIGKLKERFGSQFEGGQVSRLFNPDISSEGF